MIGLVDAHIIARLQRVKKGGQSVMVYGPGAARPKGKTVPPCFVVSHYMPPQPDMDLTRPYLDDYTPSATQATVIFPKAFDENGEPVTITGPDSWTHRKWPIPHKLFYQVDIETTDKDHFYAMYLGMSEALPIPYTFRIGSCAVKMNEAAKPHSMDEPEKPLFRSSYSFKCSNVWVARSLSDVVPGMKEINVDMGLQ